jgi:hypothetical protein
MWEKKKDRKTPAYMRERRKRKREKKEKVRERERERERERRGREGREGGRSILFFTTKGG